MLPLGFASFLVFGILLVLVGANQADLAASLALDMEGTGLLGASLSLGLGLGVLVAGPVVDRLPRRPVFCFATAMTGACLFTVEGDISLPRAALHVAGAGFFAGVFETLLNAVAVERYTAHSSRPVTFLHAAATLGAVVGPPLLGWITLDGGFVLAFRATAAAAFALSLWGAFARFLGERPAPGPEEPRTPDTKTTLAQPWLLGLCVVSFCYIGVEASLTIFAVPYATGALALPVWNGQMAISTFWLGLLVGRLLLLASQREFQPRLFVWAGLCAAILIATATAFRIDDVALWFGLCGLVLAGVFPALVTLTGTAFPHHRGTAIGIAVGAGSFGGFVLPWIVGAVGDWAGIRIALASLALGCLALAAVALALRAFKRPGEGPPQISTR